MALGIHALDLASWVKGLEVSEVMAIGRSGFNTMLTVIMVFSDGSQGIVTCSSESGFAQNNISGSYKTADFKIFFIYGFALKTRE